MRLFFAPLALVALLAACPAPADPGATASPACFAMPEDQSVVVRPLPPGVVVVRVNNLHCATCAKSAVARLYSVPGVLRVSVDFPQNTLTVQLQPRKDVDLLRVWDAVAVEEVRAVEMRVLRRRLLADEIDSAKRQVALARTGGVAPR